MGATFCERFSFLAFERLWWKIRTKLPNNSLTMLFVKQPGYTRCLKDFVKNNFSTAQQNTVLANSLTLYLWFKKPKLFQYLQTKQLKEKVSNCVFYPQLGVWNPQLGKFYLIRDLIILHLLSLHDSEIPFTNWMKYSHLDIYFHQFEILYLKLRMTYPIRKFFFKM